MSRKTITLKCKNCGKEFSYSENAYKLASEKDTSRPRRCDKCSSGHGIRLKSLPTPYFSFNKLIGESASVGNCDQELAFRGKRVQKEETRQADQSGMDISITDEEIIKLYRLLEENQVVIMVSPTGTGKSTYVPKRLVQAPDNYSGDFVDRLLRQGQIIITQPRIMATDGTAKTTAKISGELFGQRGMFGIRHSKDKESFSAWNKCVSITDGTLPNWIREGKLGQYSLIMVDEAHERSCTIEVILGLLMWSLSRYPHLHVIISSATINTQKFLESFKEAGISCQLFDIPSRKKFKKFEHFWQSDEPIVWYGRDENGQDISQKCGCWLCKKTATERRKFWQGKKAIIGRYDLSNACADFALEILKETMSGSILVFLDGEPSIKATVDRIKARCPSGVEVIPVYRKIQNQAKQELERTKGRRRVIVATNIAETSITIPDLVYCVNSGWIKQKEWDLISQIQKLKPKLHSKDGNSQRGGRLGRNQDGYVYHLFTKKQWEGEMEEHTSPEITRSPLDDSLTILKTAGITDINNFPWMEKTADMAKEMQRANRSLFECGVTDEKGHVLEKALSLLRIPRSSTEASVLSVADEQGIFFETLTVLIMMSERDGTPHTGANLYSPYQGLLCWDSAWTARTKSKVWAIHQGLKIGCRDDLDFVIKLFLCFQRAENNRLSKEWADYHCVNYNNLERIASQIKDLVKSLGDEREESQRQLSLSNLDKVRSLFLSAWPDRVINLVSVGDQILYGSGPVSPHCAGNWEGEEKALAMSFVEQESVIDALSQRFPTASFMISLSDENEPKDLFFDQKFPVGSLVETKNKAGKTFVSKLSELPPSLALSYRKKVWSEKKSDVSFPFDEKFLMPEMESQVTLEGFWIKEKKLGQARIIRWADEEGVPFALLTSFSEQDIYSLIKQHDASSVDIKIHRVIRDPIGKNGWILARTPELEIPVELSELSLHDWGAGLELIKGEKLTLAVKNFEADGFPCLSNLEKIKEDLENITEEVSGSAQRTRDSKKPFIDLQGILVNIIKDQERAVVAVPRENGIVQIFELNQSYVPGDSLKYLRLNEEVVLQVSAPDNGVEISTENLSDEEIKARPKSWKEGQTENKISVPARLTDGDLAEWNASPEALDYVKRRSWQYCLKARVVLLKARISSLKKWMTIEAIVERISHNEKGETYVHVVFGDNIPYSGPKKYLAPEHNEVSEGDELSLCITSLEPLRLADRDTEIQQKKETIVRWQNNISNSDNYISGEEQKINKIQANVAKIGVQLNRATSPIWIERYKQWITEGNEQIAQKIANIARARQQIAEQEEKISPVLMELEKLK